MMHRLLTFVTVTVAIALHACGGSSVANATAPTSVVATSTTSSSAAAATSLPAIYTQFRSAVTVQAAGSYIVLQSRDVPDHPSPYWTTGSPLYEPPTAGVMVNPFHIVEQSLTLRVPATPTAGSNTDTPLGPMGMALNGVALFNQYAAGRVPLTTEIYSFDRFNGHPTPNNEYHYHMEPLAITNGNRAGLVGVLLDGFPVYGPDDSGGRTPTGLDACNGHVGSTPDYPNGIYHYHTTSVSPYIAGCFHGAPGSVG